MFGVWLETSIHLQFKPRHPLKIELEHDCGKILVRFIMLYQRVATEAMHIYTYMAQRRLQIRVVAVPARQKIFPLSPQFGIPELAGARNSTP